MPGRSSQVSAQFVLESPEIALEVRSTMCCTAAMRSAKCAIVVVLPPDAAQWQAVRDRLMRACRPLSER